MNKRTRIAYYVKLLPRLGVGNALAVARYRRQWRNGTLEAMLPASDANDIVPFWDGRIDGPAPSVSTALAATIIAHADAIGAGKFQRFANDAIDEGETPAWHKGVYAKNAAQHFTHVAINAVAGEDVKRTWDLSRMHWAPRLALAASISTGEARTRYLDRLSHLTTDWLKHNPYQCGANWACAHEVSVRGFQLMLTHMLLEKHLGLTPTKTLLTMMEQSWKRVYAVRGYARAQQNNHSLAEHLFLIYAAAFLQQCGVHIAPSSTLKKLAQGLAPLVDLLIMDDGGSVMYSTNYHRIFCDILSIGKLLDDRFALGLFADARITQKTRAAFDFLAALIDPISGQMPLIGHNDGSLHCVQFTPFRDAEPSLLWMGAAFNFAIPKHAKRSEHSVWLFGYASQDAKHEHALAPASTHALQRFDSFGLAVFSSPHYRAYVKYPRNRFRPAQCDFLHLDLWVAGTNILHDSGTYSYNLPEPSPCEDMSDASAHNMPAPMHAGLIPKLSAFLYAVWPRAYLTQTAEAIDITVPLARSIRLHRRIALTATTITLIDQVRGHHPWQVTFNGAITRADASGATVGNSVAMRFDNVSVASIRDAMIAPNYHTLVASKRLTLTPRDANRPITTTLTIAA